jgi:hypothetical protein
MATNFLIGSFSSVGVDMAYPCRPMIDGDRRYKPKWDYERRGRMAMLFRREWVARWPLGGLIGTDGVTPMAHLGQNWGSGGFNFESWNVGNGSASQKVIKGTVLDAVSVPVANAIVQGFVTATDEFVGEVTAAIDGTYVLPTNKISTVAHYLVAYKAGSPDIAGTTVNTLLPTDIDA